MELRDALRRTFVKPVWLPGPPKVERWTCPACDREVERVSPAWKGIWFTAEAHELTALCARIHGRHDRRGDPVVVEEPVVGDDAVPIVAVDPGPADGGPPRSFVALLPPHGVAFVLDQGAATYELRRPSELSPSSLVGQRAATMAGEVIGRVAVADLRFDGSRAVRVVAEAGLAVGDPTSGDAFEGGEGPAPV